MNDLTAFQRDLLYVTAGLDNPKGLTIRDELVDYYKTEITSRRVYANLDNLVERGLIEKGQKDLRSNYYALTDRGSRAIKAYSEWESKILSS